MSNLEKVLEEKGIKAGVPFMINYKGHDYRVMFENNRLKVYDVYFDRYRELKDEILVSILVGDTEVKEVEFPVFGDTYYVPDLVNGYKADTYMGSKLDEFYKENKLLCKTKEKAVKLSDYFKKSAKNINFEGEDK